MKWGKMQTCGFLTDTPVRRLVRCGKVNILSHICSLLCLPPKIKIPIPQKVYDQRFSTKRRKGTTCSGFIEQKSGQAEAQRPPHLRHPRCGSASEGRRQNFHFAATLGTIRQRGRYPKFPHTSHQIGPARGTGQQEGRGMLARAPRERRQHRPVGDG